MAKLTYAAIATFDEYVEDEEGRFGWATPDEEVYPFVNDLERPIATSLYGRRMTKLWCSGRPRAPRKVGRRCSTTMPGSRGGREDRVLPNASDGIQREDVLNPC
jgi:hypothetical protein